ncbi:competence protein ComK [Staphylococcus massiliensis]|uniref:competence protein ComK n=1 Tax=Staphylococcus massiliensis TaxID=555791 RepID=UPI001EDDFF05|nr:competence protein ComK [Staphylococcus massiliensis]MCG3412101.1 competence protein ComK [Staphylococcus massiliensis]
MGYIIRRGDMVVRPVFIGHIPSHQTEVMRYSKHHEIVDSRVRRIIERSCKFYGDTYLGRKMQTKRLTEISNKTPILLTPLFPTYFFPTHSDRSFENTWINIHYLEDIKPLKGAKCKVYFSNLESINVNISYHSMRHQYMNCIYYYYLMDKHARLLKNDPDNPIDYSKSQLNLFEALTHYYILQS